MFVLNPFVHALAGTVHSAGGCVHMGLNPLAVGSGFVGRFQQKPLPPTKADITLYYASKVADLIVSQYLMLASLARCKHLKELLIICNPVVYALAPVNSTGDCMH